MVWPHDDDLIAVFQITTSHGVLPPKEDFVWNYHCEYGVISIRCEINEVLINKNLDLFTQMWIAWWKGNNVWPYGSWLWLNFFVQIYYFTWTISQRRFSVKSSQCLTSDLNFRFQFIAVSISILCAMNLEILINNQISAFL